VLLLAFDTATAAVTVALHDGTRVIAEEFSPAARSHGELLAAAVGRVLSRAGATPGDLAAVAVGTGPGPYTGLRAGVVTAKVMGSALGIGVHGVCTLDVLARAAARELPGREFLVATDARRKEVYWARYGPGAVRLAGPGVASPADLVVTCPVAGEGPVLYPELLGEPSPPRYPAAGDLAQIVSERISRGDPPGPAEPIYLRKPDARPPGKPKRVTPS